MNDQSPISLIQLEDHIMQGGGEEAAGTVVVRGRVEIDTRRPFRSVKEAVVLFGEKILAGQVYGNKLKEMENSKARSFPRLGPVTAELEETKQSLEKAKEEGNIMADCLTSLKKELEQTKRELYQLKTNITTKSHFNIQNAHHDIDHIQPEIEELKFVENTAKLVQEIKGIQEKNNVVAGAAAADDDDKKYDQYGLTNKEFQKKRSVKFASPPLLTKMIVTEDNINTNNDRHDGEKPTASPSKKKIKKKPLVPLLGGLFSKKKGSNM